TWTVSERLDLTAGMRLDYVVRTLQRTVTANLPPVPPVAAEADFFTAAPQLGLQYEVISNVVVYGRSTLGFKPGGFSAYINPPASPRFATERNWVSEMGTRSTWLDDRLGVNAALFYSIIWDYQVERTAPNLVDLAVYNAPRVTVYGAELELQARPLDGLELTAAAGVIDSEFDKFTDPGSGLNLAGRRTAYVPQFTATVAAHYRHRTGWFGRIEYQAIGRTYYDETNTPLLAQNSYNLLHARLGWETNHLRFAVFGQNLTDTAYYVRKIADLIAGVPGWPRVVGVQLELRF
ncbi:MAG: TonB-dependent receptor, partial [Verrucomicrobiae bacterium]|nr:TonB-dependent receptor [Verrucomicrobiae bacterium]